MSYYQRRGLEDAQHEQELEVKTSREHHVLEKKIRKELKKNDKSTSLCVSSKKVKKSNKRTVCDSHCHHSEYCCISIRDVLIL
jgi:hypothetical protein